MIRRPRRPLVLSSAALVVANLIPLAGVLAGGWRVFDVLVLFWAENVVIGVFTILRMLSLVPRGRLAGAPLALFFLVHYGIFATVHGVFVVTLFGPAGIDPRLVLGLLAAPPLLFPLFALAASHGTSFVANFLLGGEIDRVRPIQLMTAPYGRVVVLHVTVIFGGFAVAAAGAPTAALGLLVVLKIALDLGAHVVEHRALAAKPSPGF